MLAKKKRNSFIKRALLFLSFSGSLFLLSGCWDRVEINDLAIITAAAIDKKDVNQVELSLQIFIPKAMGGGQGGGGGGSGGENVTFVISQTGVNIADALSKLQADFPRKIFWGQCKVFLFGEELAREGVYESLDFLLRHPEPRERGYVFVSKGKAKNILAMKTNLEPYSGEAVREIATLGSGLAVTLQDFDELLTGASQGAVLPYMKVASKKGDKESSYDYTAFIGGAVFKKDRMVGDLSRKETRGLLWLKNEIKEYTVTVRPPGEKGELSFTLGTVQVNVDPQIKNKEWKMKMDVEVTGMVIQNGTNLDVNDPNSLKLVQQAFQKSVKQRIEGVIGKAQHELKADIADFAEEFHRKYPKQWKRVENRWEEVFPRVKVQVQVKAEVRRQGYINQPEKARERGR
ncbi:Ger(x)C family spore germination protein [Bacillus sp. FJAT-27231]|uniref:Ger(x)C family spore germination protein n=1 Tax=Bacillus sp. FJAT-27231 TaxID=1679168 RepID=UPI0006715C3A|nr:Ger(x)C family spore germination protein [Bacillus sp. FJAT-27231]